MGGAGRSWEMGAQPPYRQAQVVEEDATVKLRSLGYALDETQATARDPEALSSSIASGVENSSSCSCRGHAQAGEQEQEWMAELRQL
jgi:hypothetical protein